MDSNISDRIETQVWLNAPRQRVWQALTDSSEFGTWFRAVFEGEFTVGAVVSARSTYPGNEKSTFEITIERIEPESTFSFTWCPSTPDMDIEPADRTATLVEFSLEESSEGTLLRMTESGFNNIPLGHRDEIFRSNSAGWAEQMENIKRHV